MSTRPYANTALRYLESGWSSPIPLPWGKKGDPPKGTTGHDGHPPTIHTVRMWCTMPAFAGKAGGNIGLVMPDDVIGIDVDHYGDKRGGDKIAELEKTLGPLPPTFRSTARFPEDEISGIRFYQVPAGRKWVGSIGPDIEIIQRVHRYAVVSPSIHDKLGVPYCWVQEYTDGFLMLESEEFIPYVSDLSDLPDAWAEFLTESEEYVKPSERVEFTAQDRDGILTGGEPCRSVRLALDKYAERKANDSARYTAMNDTVMALTRLGEQGHDGAHSALLALREVYLEDIEDTGRSGSGEFKRSLNGAIGKVLGDPTPEEDKGCGDGGSQNPLGAWEPPEGTGRWMDLGAYLDGTYVPPQPCVGAARKDGIQLLYPGMWHTCVGLTTAGKTMFALWHVKVVLESGGHVIYIHFEESSPNTTVHRLKGMGVDVELIRKQFHFGNIDSAWKLGEMAQQLQRLNQTPTLAVLDGINAACGMHGWSVKEPESVGAYRSVFVHPLTKVGCTVLSLGHPPKAMNRQGESYSYGAAGWLNDVDGASYWMTASRDSPITKGITRFSNVALVKDRPGEVQRHGQLNPKEMTQWYMGAFTVLDNNTGTIHPETGQPIYTEMHLTVPGQNEEGAPKDSIDTLAERITQYLQATTGRFESKTKLEDGMRAKSLHVPKNDTTPALLRLMERGVIEWPEKGGARPGWLTGPIAFDPETGTE